MELLLFFCLYVYFCFTPICSDGEDRVVVVENTANWSVGENIPVFSGCEVTALLLGCLVALVFL